MTEDEKKQEAIQRLKNAAILLARECKTNIMVEINANYKFEDAKIKITQSY